MQACLHLHYLRAENKCWVLPSQQGSLYTWNKASLPAGSLLLRNRGVGGTHFRARAFLLWLRSPAPSCHYFGRPWGLGLGRKGRRLQQMPPPPPPGWRQIQTFTGRDDAHLSRPRQKHCKTKQRFIFFLENHVSVSNPRCFILNAALQLQFLLKSFPKVTSFFF